MLPLPLLDHLLNTPPRVIFAHRDTFTGHSTGLERIRSHRYIRVLRGNMDFMLEGTTARLEAGQVLLVARGTLREWTVPPGQLCETLWCEFDTPGLTLDPHTIYAMDDAAGLEKQALERVRGLWSFPRHLRGGNVVDPQLPREVALRMEGELKASLARFWIDALPGSSRSVTLVDALHPAVQSVLAWLEQNYALPDAPKRLESEVLELSPSHFRLLFREQVGASLGEHLHRLRMREAMSLLRKTSLSIKEIAGRVGFNDALYFSRRFREHWDIAPSEVRR